MTDVTLYKQDRCTNVLSSVKESMKCSGFVIL